MERGSRRFPAPPTSCWLKVNLGLSGKRDFIYICRECQPASPDCSGLMMSPGAQVPRDVSLACFLRHKNESGTGQQRPPTPPGRGRSPGPGGHTGARASSSAPPAPQPRLQQPPLHEPRAAEARPARRDPARGLGAAGEATSGRAGAVFVSRSPLTVGSRSSAPQTPSAQESGPWRVWALGQTTPVARHRGGGCP